METYLKAQQEDDKSYTDVFHGIKTSIAIVLLFLWIPCIVIYLVVGWWCIIAYYIMLMIAVTTVRPLMNKGRAQKTLISEKTFLESS
jgi:uncharacterized membrane protein